MVRKKHESLSRENIYIEKKKKSETLTYQLKKIKRLTIG